MGGNGGGFPSKNGRQLNKIPLKYLSIYLSLLVRSYMSITPGSANLEILIK